MSFVGTLAKVALGMSQAKGGSNLARAGRGEIGGSGGLLNGDVDGTGEERIANLLGGKVNHLGQFSGNSMGAMLERLGRSASLVRHRSSSAGSGGMSDAISQLSRNMCGARGGLGKLLEQLSDATSSECLGKTPAQRVTSERSFGEELNSAFASGAEPWKKPSPAQNVAAAVLVKALLQSAKADEVIDQTERERLLSKLDGMHGEERAFVKHVLEAPIDIERLTSKIPSGLEPQAYAVSVMAADPDCAKDTAYLEEFANALGLPEAVIEKVHTELGVAPLAVAA
ncbi:MULTISPECIES: DUF533 domain-containing protein [Thioclava]|uniref:DUF533 domain-containing protein n=1 Tax=Thioclava litoralis TaxID=3076557 RepID=A0ABZ1E2Q2_9RHOB|nr:DUF533 domain-containing protein [Thioclava sp. FTW29]